MKKKIPKFKDLQIVKEKAYLDVERASVSTANNDFLIEICKRLAKH